MHLFAGTAHPQLGKALAKELDTPLGKVTLRRFSCGECYVKFEESVRGKSVYLLQSIGQDPDHALMELFLMCQAAKLSFAKSVHVILPHFPYARQDRIAEPREPISAKLVAHLLESSGADHVITLNLHSDQIQGFFSIPVDALDTRQIFKEHFQKKVSGELVVVSPDVGGAKQAKRFADTLGAKLAVMHKVRRAHQKVEVVEVVGDVAGKRCIIYDDMIDTAGSIVSAKEALEKRGAHPEVFATATHPIFSGSAIERLKKAHFKKVVVTDSTPVKRGLFPGLTILPIAPLLAQVIQHMERGESVTDIYKG